MSNSKFQIFLWLMIAGCVVSCKNPLGDNQSGSKIDDTFHPGATAVDPVLQNFILNIPFTSGTESSYVISDASRVELADGVVRLKKADQTDDVVNTLPTSGGFMNGTLTGVQWDSTNNYVRLNTTTNNAELDASWTPQWSSLVGYWKMNNTWTDAFGSNNGTATNGASFSSASKIGSYSGTFDGMNDYTSLGTLGTFGSSMGPGFSIALWVKTSATGTGKAIIGTSNGAAGRGSFSIRLNVKADNTTAMIGAIRIGFGSNDTTVKYLTSAVEVNTGITDGNWHHLAVVVTPLSNTVVLTLDGQLQPITYQTQGSPTVFSDFSYPVMVGGLNSAGTPVDFISAQLDDLAIWSAALSVPQIQTIYARQTAKYSGQLISRVFDAYSSQSWTTLASKTTLPFYKELPGAAGSEANDSGNYSAISANLMSGLKGYWRFNESSFSTAPGGKDFFDASGNSFHGTQINSPTLSVNGQLGGAIGLNGTNQRVALGTTVVGSETELTVFAKVWIKSFNTSTTADIRTPYVVSWNSYSPGSQKGFGLTTYYQLASGLHSIGFSIADGANYCSASTPQLSTTAVTSTYARQWLNIVGVFKANSYLRIYVNGELVSTSTSCLPTHLSSPTTNIYVGYSGVNPGYLNGLVDEVAIWNRALTDGTSGTDNEILQLYRRGGNRLKYQIRSCANSDCSDQDALTTTFKGWKGPDNTGLSYFSELYNTTNNVLAGTVSTGTPTMTFSNFSGTGLSVTNNSYFQYRAILESDDQNNLCNYGLGAVSCSPELKSIAIGPNHYSTTVQSITSTVAIGSAFQTLDTNGLTEAVGSNSCTSGARYSVSRDGTNFYYWNGSAWVTSTNDTTANDAATLRSNISAFPTAVGIGTLQVRTYLRSSGTSPCEIDNLQFTGRKY